jgi:flagellar biosynthesis activator protein FlaF
VYQFPYAEIAFDDMREARRREREVFDSVISRLTDAKDKGVTSRETAEALFYLDRFWKILMEDLSHAENALSDALKANLISIGIWMLKEIEAIRFNKVTSLDALIDINGLVRDGLK